MIRLNRDGVLAALDGGIESAVVTTLASQAVGTGRVYALIHRDRDTSAQQIQDAAKLADWLKIRYRIVDVTPMLSGLGLYRGMPLWAVPVKRIRDWLVKHVHSQDCSKTAEPPLAAALLGTKGVDSAWLNQVVACQRARVRQRMVVQYYYAELGNLLVLGNCNKTHKSVGAFVKYGDVAADVAPVESLFRTQVAQLADFLGLPTPASDRLAAPAEPPGIIDEQVTGMPDDLLDRTLIRLERGLDSAAIATYLGLETEQVDYIRRLIRRSQHMRNHPRVTGHR